MLEELHESSTSLSSLNNDKLCFTKSIPNLTVTISKYSSTESDLTSDDDDGRYIGNRKLSHSGFSTSTASLSGSFRKRTKRRRQTWSGMRVSSSSLSIGRSANTDCVIIAGQMTTQKHLSGSEVSVSRSESKRRTEGLPTLNSVNDLKHATGRHRGISGGSVPAVDAALFAMFYVTDIFDELLSDTTHHHQLHPQYAQLDRNNQAKRDLLSLLKREIVYSLRMNYFCPASKVVKLVQLVEEHYPLDYIQDVARVFDVIFGKLLKIPPFLTYSNGTSNFTHPIHLENYSTRQYYYQPVALTVQKLLLQRNIFCNGSKMHTNLKGYDNLNFVTVPYPALILQIIRKEPDYKSADGEDPMYYWNQSSETHHNQHKRPIIPNLKIDITSLISRGFNYDGYTKERHSSNWSVHQSFSKSNSFMTSFQSESSLSGELGNDDGVGGSRIVQGLKSAWTIMFRYLEDLSISTSSYTSPSESPSYNRNSSSPGTTNLLGINGRIDDAEKKWCDSVRKINHSSASSSSLLSSPLTLDYSHHTNDLEDSFTASQHIQVKMELIAVICNSKKNVNMEECHEKENEDNNAFSRYAVYCKAGSDVSIAGENTYYAPWVLYQPRTGSVSQVVLIENFGKWMDSLEKHHENLNLREVPMEIRRVLEDSHLFIYKRVENERR